MALLIRGCALAWALLSFLALVPDAFGGTSGRVRIKNGHGLTVVLGKTREVAVGIRPEKKLWIMELDAAFVGAEAELRDVTPDVAGARWNVPVKTERVVLDAERFLPGHVYRLELRRERQLLGSALVYLYPPPSDRVSRVVLEEGPESAENGSGPATIPKGGL